MTKRQAVSLSHLFKALSYLCKQDYTQFSLCKLHVIMRDDISCTDVVNTL